VDAYVDRRQLADLQRVLGDLLPPQKPPAFFISYRRSQNTWQARDIRKELVRRYGESRVFMDTSSIDYGESFPDRIASAIRGCGVILGLIGPHWLEPTAGSRRIDDPNDWVRRELEAALQRQEALVIPVLLDGASAPSAADLPESIQGLATLHAVVIVGEDLAADIDNLLTSIERGQRRAANRDTSEKTAARNADDENNT
jgi:TIR domain